MNPQLKAQWLAALRGQGEKQYKQGHHILRSSDDTYCCLGVLCDLLDPQGWDGRVTYTGGRAYCFQGYSGTFPGPETLRKAGIETRAPGQLGSTPESDFLSYLAGRNDAEASFEEIADKIEQSQLL